MFLKTIVYLLIVMIIITVTALPTGSPVCTVGSAAPQSPHTLYAPNVFGTIDLRGFQVKIGDVVLTSSAANTIAANTNLTLEVSSSNGTQFKGVLVILNQENVNLASSLTVDPASTVIKLQDSCAPAGYGGFTHRSRTLKSSVTATVNLPSSQNAFLDVNIVVNNNATAGSAYFYTRFTLMTAAAAPIPIPFVPTVPVPVEPTAPIPDTPLVPVPVTPPVAIPVKAPVTVPVTPPVAVPVKAPVTVPVKIPVPTQAPLPRTTPPLFGPTVPLTPISSPTRKVLVPLPSPPVASPATVANPVPNAPVTVPLMMISPVPPITNPAPNAPVLAPFAPIVSSPTVTNPTAEAPIKAPLSVPIAQIMPIVSPTQAPLPKTKPPQLGPTTPGVIIDIYPDDDFVGKLNDASAGDTIIIHQGDYTASGEVIISIGGTMNSPVVIRRAVDETRPGIRFTINIAGSTYLTIQGLDILSTGGNGINILNTVVRENKNITLEDLIIHDVGIGIKTEANVDGLRIRKAHINATLNKGEGLSLGCDDGSCLLLNSIIEYNWIHDTTADGIVIKKNSFGNIVRHNVVYKTNYHGIHIYGTGSEAVNIVEGNVMWDCAQAGIKVAADSIVQNNLVFHSGYGMDSDFQNGVTPKNLKIVHNTFLNNDVCLSIRSWNGQFDILFANNAVYCNKDKFDVLDAQSGQLSGNVFYPSASSFPPTSVSLGRSLAQDFKGFASLNAYPTNTSPLRDKADPKHAVGIDFDGTSRMKQSPTVGAYEWTTADASKWAVTEGFKPFQEIDVGPNGPIPTLAPVAVPTIPVTPSDPCRLRRFCIFGRKICFSGHNTVQILKRHNNSSTNIPYYKNPTDSDTIMMSELNVGDFVRSSSGQYTRVISFCHKDTQAVATFIQIHSLLVHNNHTCRKHSNSFYKINSWNLTNYTGHDRQSTEDYDDYTVVVEVDDDVCNAVETLPILELSHDHMVYVFRRHHHQQHQQHHHRNPTEFTRSTEKGWARAADVEIGDMLIHRLNDSNDVYYGVVTNVTTIQRTDGVYSPITTTGSLYVSNTMVSSYVAVLQSPTVMHSPSDIPVTAITSSMPTMLLVPPDVQHMIAHITLTPIRLLCYYDFEKYCQNEVYDDIDSGYAWYSRYILYYVEWLESLGTIPSPPMFPQLIFEVLIRTIQWANTIVIMVPFLFLYLFEVCVSFIVNEYDNTNHVDWFDHTFDTIPDIFYSDTNNMMIMILIIYIIVSTVTVLGFFLVGKKAMY